MDALLARLRLMIEEAEAAGIEQKRALSEAAAGLSASELSELVAGARTIRLRHFDAKMFGEPAWDIMLGLHQAHHNQQAISISAAVTYGNTSPTTGLRWLNELERSGLVERTADCDDHRRSIVALTPDAVERMDAFTRAFAAWVATKAALRRI